MTGKLDYGIIMNSAMRFFVQQVLKKVSKEGLPGDHHFFITIDCKCKNLEMTTRLREKYPDEITIVMQHWFDKLEVGEKGFSVTLNFGDIPETLYIPYVSILTFVDPSVEFGVKFEKSTSEQDTNELTDSLHDITVSSEQKLNHNQSSLVQDISSNNVKTKGEVVQLDTFRKF